MVKIKQPIFCLHASVGFLSNSPASFLQAKGTSQAEATVTGGDVIPKPTNQFALLEFERPVTCPTDSLVIGSRLDADAYILDWESSNLIPWQQGGKEGLYWCADSCHKSGKVLLLSTHKGLLKTTLDCPLVIILDHLIHKIKWWQYVYTRKSVNPVPIVIKFILILLISYPLPIINLLSLKWRQFATHDQSTLRSLATLSCTLFTMTSFCLIAAHIHPVQVVHKRVPL